MDEKNIIVIFGESICAGRAKLDFAPQLQKDKYFIDPYNAIEIFNPTSGQNELIDFNSGNHTTDANKSEFGPTIKLAALLNARGEGPATICLWALGGSSLAPVAQSGSVHSFDKVTGSMYSALLSHITDCHSNVIAQGFTPKYLAVVSVLGLNDSSDLIPSQNFESNMNNLISNLYTDSPEIAAQNPPFILTSPNVDAGGINNIDITYLNNVKTGCANVATGNSNVTLVSFDGIPLIDPSMPVGNIHHNWRGELEADSVGDRIYAAIPN